MTTKTTNKALGELEARRDAALGRIKERSIKLRGILEERDRYLKESYAREQEELKGKARESGELLKCGDAIMRIERKIPEEVSQDISRRESSIRQLEMRKRGLERELHGVKHDMKTLEDRGSRDPHVFKTLREQIVSLEGALNEVDEDLDDEKKGLEAAHVIRREALEALTEEAEKELASLAPSA